jgi:stage II sporulation protein GA (sporulation sigma-E factor processing peptidase)
MALGGIALGVGNGGLGSLVAAAAGISLICAVGFREKLGSVSYVPVYLSYGGKSVRLTALCDTGNTLRDPVTGRSVLVVGADVAQQLTGLTKQQLQSPVQTMSQAPLSGLRLVPYHAVGQDSGLLLALRMQDVIIGKWKGSSLVAFAPQGLSMEGNYQALTGGAA